jgi:hypothetical protein
LNPRPYRGVYLILKGTNVTTVPKLLDDASLPTVRLARVGQGVGVSVKTIGIPTRIIIGIGAARP